jgi:hypothetical protein
MFNDRFTRALQTQNDERCRFFFLFSRPATALPPWAASNGHGQCNAFLARLDFSFDDFIGLSQQNSISASPYMRDQQREEQGAPEVAPMSSVQRPGTGVITGAR